MCEKDSPRVCFNGQVDELAGAFEGVCEACSAFQDYLWNLWGTFEELHVFVKILQHCLLLPPVRSWVLPAGQLEQSVWGEFHRQWSSSRQSPWVSRATNALSREWHEWHWVSWFTFGAARWAHFIRPFVGICGSRRLWSALWSPSNCRRDHPEQSCGLHTGGLNSLYRRPI